MYFFFVLNKCNSSIDISQSVHIEAMLRQPDFQTKAFRSTSKAAIRGALALQKAFKKDDRINRKLAATLSPPTKKKYTPVSSSKLLTELYSVVSS